MEEFVIKALQLILSLSILVFLHELGHFIPARLFKTRVEKFYLFFNPWFSLFKKKIGETEWGIGWLPLGGYVKIAGMIDESMDKEQMEKPAEEWEFRSKKPWQRLIIMTGGVIVNIIVGFVLYMLVLGVWGEDKIAAKDLQQGMAVNPIMEQYGIKSGDNIIKINGETVSHIDDVNAGIMYRNQYELTVQHPDGSTEEITLDEDIEYMLFREGAFPVVGLRAMQTQVELIISISDYTHKEHVIKAGTPILSINGEDVNKIEDFSSIANSEKNLNVVLQEGEDKVEYTIGADEASAFLFRFPCLYAGMHKGDQIIALNDRPITFFDEIQSELYANKKGRVDIELLRGKDTIKSSVRVSRNGTIGFGAKPEDPIDKGAIKHIDYSFGESIGAGFAKGAQTLSDYVGQLKFIFTKKGATSIGGFGAIGKMFAPSWNWRQFWATTALISIILAFMNILPIPALDGGHVVFVLYEMVTGREAPQKVLEVAQMIGFFLLLALILYANGNDIYNAIFG